MKLSNEKKGLFVAQGIDPNGNQLRVEASTRVEARETWLAVFALRYTHNDARRDGRRAA